MKNKIPPFYIGQKVIAIRNHSRGLFKKGEVFVVRALTQCVCGNWGIVITNPTHKKYRCGCGHEVIDIGQFGAWSFRPLEEMKAPLLTFEQIKKEEKEEVLILN